MEDEKWASVHFITSVSSFTSTGSDGSGSGASIDISLGSESGKEVHTDGSLGNVIEVVIDDQWHAWNLIDSVTSGLDQWDASGGGQSRAKSVSSLVKIDFSVPSSPGLKWSEHSTFSGHVSEGGLASSLRT